MPPLVPGSAPKKAPRPEPRSIGPNERRQSSRGGQLVAQPELLRDRRCTRDEPALLITSATANSPIAIGIRPMPSDSSGMSKPKRMVPLLTSVPTMPRIRPTTIIATPLIGEPCPTVEAAIRPSSISEQYSAGPNFSAASASIGANSISSTMPTAEPQNEATHFMNSAMPPRPCLAIG